MIFRFGLRATAQIAVRGPPGVHLQKPTNDGELIELVRHGSESLCQTQV
jgi:hypothetical protein